MDTKSCSVLQSNRYTLHRSRWPSHRANRAVKIYLTRLVIAASCQPAYGASPARCKLAIGASTASVTTLFHYLRVVSTLPVRFQCAVRMLEAYGRLNNSRGPRWSPNVGILVLTL
uniref:SFRICE_011318 n=1 Tax=Spodoptera frugiperda TaxID=7108 RepID=A0A2H1WZM3_SPOFR